MIFLLASILLIFQSVFSKSNNNDNLYEGCFFNLTDSTGTTADYDLTYFNLDEQVFEVEDSLNKEFLYMFNLCGRIPKIAYEEVIPPACKNSSDKFGPCTHIKTGDQTCAKKDIEPTDGVIPSAIQYNSEKQICKWLGMQLPKDYGEPDFKLELYDKDNAGRGVIYTITNGQWCGDAHKNRELKVGLICPDEKRMEFDPAESLLFEEEEVDEYPMCVYYLEYESALACPNRCISRRSVDMFAVCDARGICVSDKNIGIIRCLCDDGTSGNQCQEKYSDVTVMQSDHSGLLAAIVICIVLLGAAIVLAAVLCHKIRIRESQQAQNSGHVGLINAENENNAEQAKAAGQSMEIGNNTGAVSLQTVDDQLKTDGNELLDEAGDENL